MIIVVYQIYSLEAIRCIFATEKGPELYFQLILAFNRLPAAHRSHKACAKQYAGYLICTNPSKYSVFLSTRCLTAVDSFEVLTSIL